MVSDAGAKIPPIPSSSDKTPVEDDKDYVVSEHIDGDSTVVSDTVSFMPVDIKVMSSAPDYNHAQMIDNSRINYVPIKLRCGVVAMCRTNVLILCRSVLKALNEDIKQCLELFPSSVHAFIKRTRIWINLTYSYGQRDNPRLLKHTTAHHAVWWLNWARDRPDKMHSIEIYDCWEYLQMRLHWNGAGLICHEFCHLIHQFALPNGLGNTQLWQAYCKARESGLYDKALRRDWAGTDCDTDIAYAMVDYKEFWSEMSVAYLSDTYHHLDKVGGHAGMDACSPPFRHPVVLERVQKRQVQQDMEDDKGIPRRQLVVAASAAETNEKMSWWERFLRRLRECFISKDRRRRKGQHRCPPCNKFYPFTRGQLREHDKGSFLVISDLWRQVAQWEDPMDDRICGPGFRRGGGRPVSDAFAPLLAPTDFQQPPEPP
ncbi:Transmembrane amino acid transporter protein [Seminavis robusta]|uniref:Transmembrane amino acid transporter protein n=1 Tax=Seminavis robusta TaxID=568900 RepID=A0A9N8EP88_9STRA|nr:Transmembrane amino acid transporter protein [Seminavis robusta]|eukprot:Sro1579_g283750.1 Transmembrane amino acid transporter protein (429) ;mRNA; r:18770-20204